MNNTAKNNEGEERKKDGDNPYGINEHGKTL